MINFKGKEILCFLLIVVGYCISKMFNKRCNGFSIGGQEDTPSNFNSQMFKVSVDTTDFDA